MSLLISEASHRLIDEFAKSVGRVVCASLKVTICAGHVSIVFAQPERYSRLVNCEIRFSPNVGFFYEEICAALFSCSDIDATCHLAEVHYSDEMERNDDYVLNVINFCVTYWSEIVKTPPFWYEKAVEISDKNTRPIFPDIADENLGNKKRLLNVWRSQLHL
jgi:hypothetical protein